MFRKLSLTTSLLLGAAGAAYAQFPAQPPPVANPMTAGDEKERAACHPDVTKYCQKELSINPDDAFSILGCLQRNRQVITVACSNVLRSHGQ